MATGTLRIGVIANPVSARDIRRIIANASNLQIVDRVNIVLRVLAAAGSCGVRSVLMMPDKGGIRALLDAQPRAGAPSPPQLSRRASSSTWTSAPPSTTRSARRA